MAAARLPWRPRALKGGQGLRGCSQLSVERSFSTSVPSAGLLAPREEQTQRQGVIAHPRTQRGSCSFGKGSFMVDVQLASYRAPKLAIEVICQPGALAAVSLLLFGSRRELNDEIQKIFLNSSDLTYWSPYACARRSGRISSEAFQGAASVCTHQTLTLTRSCSDIPVCETLKGARVCKKTDHIVNRTESAGIDVACVPSWRETADWCRRLLKRAVCEPQAKQTEMQLVRVYQTQTDNGGMQPAQRPVAGDVRLVLEHHAVPSAAMCHVCEHFRHMVVFGLLNCKELTPRKVAFFVCWCERDAAVLLGQEAKA
ncbi:hypothetical protein Anapl_12958 [Anas platyrhynchos]|uniref:Uncharacterized protein n=1 Tax=Anas platyrhynchos TaxID=8839 RepID=R0KBP2_ANAPL|nr:hypothetical protein Anapl_12958 [Anas platyrhynchos]